MNRLLLLITAICLIPRLYAADADPLFQTADVLDITLNAPFELIDSERDKETEYPGTLSYTDSAGQLVVLDFNLQVRGNWRLQKRNCDYSQLWVDLKRGQLPGTIFENQNRLKLVVQCKRQDRYAEYLVKEYQAYKIFEHVSDYFFGTRLLNVTYIDSEEGDEQRTHLGFFIENQNRLQDRFNMQEVDLNSVFYGDLDTDQASLTAMFMYLLGNTDFSVAQGSPDDDCCHNAKLLEAEGGVYFPVPYDFDSSGFVDASYAAPPSSALGLRNNKSRLFRGYCVHSEGVPAATEKFRQARDRIFEIVGDTTYVSERGARSSQRFIEDFYELLDNERRYKRRIVEACRG